MRHFISMRANTQKAQRFFRPKSPEPVSDLPVDLDPEISFHNDGKFFSKKRNEFYLADPNVIYSQQNNFFNHKLFEEKKKAKDIFSFGEIGFGLGLNFIIILKNWSKVLGATKRLHYFAIESFPLSKDNLKIAKQRFPDLANEYQELIDKYPPIHTGFHRIWLKSGAVALTLIFEPTWRGISQIEGKFDAWFLSQFSNESAPDQWSPDIFSEISRLSRKDTLICSSNTGAYVDGELKRIGYEVVGASGDPSPAKVKIGRSCMNAEITLIPPWFAPPPPIGPKSRIGILGGGVAGASIVRALHRRGLQAEIIDAHLFNESTSILPVALISPTLTEKANELSNFYDRSYRSVLASIEELGAEWLSRGVLKIKPKQMVARQIDSLIRRKNLWDDAAIEVTAAEIQSKTNINCSGHGLWFAEAGTLSPVEYLLKLMNGQQLIKNQKVAQIEFLNDEWILYSERKREISRLDVLIITAALGSNTFACTRHIPLIGLGGQLSLANPTSQSLALRATILGQSYITPACGNMHAVGSTHIRGNQIYDSIAFNPTKEGHWQNYKNLEPAIQTLLGKDDICNWKGYTGVRAATPDRLPCVGPVVDPEVFREDFARLRHGPQGRFPVAPKYQPNLFVSTGLGSRGFLTAELSSEILVSQMLGEPWPVERAVALSLSPSRFLYRELRSHK